MITKEKRRKNSAIEVTVRLYIAEDLRAEASGKVSAIGLYTDNVIVVPLPKEVPEPTEEAPILLKSLAFLVNVVGPTEPVVVGIELETHGKRRPFFPSQLVPLNEPGKSINLIGIMSPCVVSSFGEKNVIVTVGDVAHSFPFEIRRVVAAPSSEYAEISIGVPGSNRPTSASVKTPRNSKPKNATVSRSRGSKAPTK